MFALCTLLEHLQATGAFAFVYRQITIESKTLPIQATGHNGHNHTIGTDKGNHTNAFSLGNGYDVGTWVGNSRASRFADDPDRMSVGYRSQVRGEFIFVGMLPNLVKCAIIDGKLTIDTTKKASGRAYLFYYEMADAFYDFHIIRRQHLTDRRVTKGTRYEVKGPYPLPSPRGGSNYIYI